MVEVLVTEVNMRDLVGMAAFLKGIAVEIELIVEMNKS